ncbi:hypothetical protein SAMN06296036_104189 [Pseudobacteriovorax antillogorgiicola]|uniref:Uncharacterized protein n=1 Tax=Pseudobacteriovorax antillogorgiicola TaxID=1513793 RepID=A0A1Y6BK82_9BACT|nr:hypothetical protein EDD56_104144 [Pseudobacteriovorax antillogorgiicola]SMF07082.1 hypothetical protein SAMN06296036_104189 [Pseudobacteriovorax antillogorgiicola]
MPRTVLVAMLQVVSICRLLIGDVHYPVKVVTSVPREEA